MTNRIYALVGPHGAGKSTMAFLLKEMGIHYIPVYTTHIFPKGDRRTDKNLEFYRSVSREELNRLDLVAQFTHKGDIYGVRKEDILGALEHHRISIMIMESSGIRQLGKFIKKNLFTVYLMADCMTLVKRMLDMSCSNEEIKYHLQYDENNHEFDNWKITDYVIKNTGTPAQEADQLLAIMGLTAVVPPDQFTRLTNQNSNPNQAPLLTNKGRRFSTPLACVLGIS